VIRGCKVTGEHYGRVKTYQYWRVFLLYKETREEIAMKRTVKPIKDEFLSDYWRRCNGSFSNGWVVKALKYAVKNGAVVKSMMIVEVN
jgi:hypothetical protein